MNLSEPFVRRPIATVLLTIGLALAGIAAFFVLPVSPLPQVDYPSISVSASLPGASPDTMASSVATPLERRLAVIAGVNEVTSSSGSGSTRINLQFELNRKIDAAAREVQAAINASRADLPATLRSNPTYRKANPSDAPVIILALTSATRSPGQVYESVSNIVQQKLAQVKGVGDVEIGGGSLPAVRVELLPFALNRYGISSEDVRAAIQATNANRPKGAIEVEGRRLQIYSAASTASGGRSAADYRDLVVAWRDGAAIRLDDVAEVTDGAENRNTLGLFNGEPAVVVLVTRQPGANVIETVDAVRALLPQLQAQLPQDVKLQVASDSTNSIRSSLLEIEFTLLISIVLVVLVVSAFLRSARATVIPAIATVVSLLGTFGVMYLNDGGPRAAQESAHDQHHQHDRDQQGELDLVQRGADRVGAVRGHLQLHVLRQLRLQLRQQRTHRIHRLDHVRARLARHQHDHGRLAVEQAKRVAVLRPVGHFRHVVEADRGTVAPGHHQVAVIGRTAPATGRGSGRINLQAPAFHLDRTFWPIGVGGLDRRPHVFGRHAIAVQRKRQQLDAYRRQRAAADLHVAHALHLRQLLLHDVRHRFIHLPRAARGRSQRQDDHWRIGRVGLAVGRIAAQRGRQVGARGIDGRLHFARRGIDLAVQFKLQVDARRAAAG